MPDRPFRLTKPTLAVLDALTRSTKDDPVWGLRIIREADLGAGTVYPILERLAEAGWIECWDERTPAHGRPPRRYYMLTNTGRQEYGAALAARSASRSRRGWTLSPRPTREGIA